MRTSNVRILSIAAKRGGGNFKIEMDVHEGDLNRVEKLRDSKRENLDPEEVAFTLSINLLRLMGSGKGKS